jgi:hypothetical protein
VEKIGQIEWVSTSKMIHELEMVNHHPIVSSFTSYIDHNGF